MWLAWWSGTSGIARRIQAGVLRKLELARFAEHSVGCVENNKNLFLEN